jgi:hypothetical protein
LAKATLMVEIYQRKTNSYYLSSRNYKRYNVLLELFYHPVHENLTDESQNRHTYQMNYEKWVVPAELQCVHELADNYCVH